MRGEDINNTMKVGDRIRLVKDTSFHKIGDEGIIEEIDHRLHAIVVQFPNETHRCLFNIAGRCASLLICNIEIVYEILKEEQLEPNDVH